MVIKSIKNKKVLYLWIIGCITVILSFFINKYLASPNDNYDKIVKRQMYDACISAQQARNIIGERLLGVDYSIITTTMGYKDAKIMSAAYDFPALIVLWLKKAGVKEGDSVAVNASGSFPALTIASMSAVHAVGAKPLLISSLGASSWGANRPELTWIDMERMITPVQPWMKSIAVSLGGAGDLALDLKDDGRSVLIDAANSSGSEIITPVAVSSITGMRINIWKEHNGGVLPALLINIGGNAAYWGADDRGVLRQEGLIIPGRKDRYDSGGVGDIFLKNSRPVIHLLGIKKIAAKYGITMYPDEYRMTGKIYEGNMNFASIHNEPDGYLMHFIIPVLLGALLLVKIYKSRS